MNSCSSVFLYSIGMLIIYLSNECPLMSTHLSPLNSHFLTNEFPSPPSALPLRLTYSFFRSILHILRLLHVCCTFPPFFAPFSHCVAHVPYCPTMFSIFCFSTLFGIFSTLFQRILNIFMEYFLHFSLHPVGYSGYPIMRSKPRI